MDPEKFRRKQRAAATIQVRPGSGKRTGPAQKSGAYAAS